MASVHNGPVNGSIQIVYLLQTFQGIGVIGDNGIIGSQGILDGLEVIVRAKLRGISRTFRFQRALDHHDLIHGTVVMQYGVGIEHPPDHGIALPGHKGTRALTGLQDTKHDQAAQSLPHRDTADPQLLGKAALGVQLVPGAQGAVQDPGQDIIGNGLTVALFFYNSHLQKPHFVVPWFNIPRMPVTINNWSYKFYRRFLVKIASPAFLCR